MTNGMSYFPRMVEKIRLHARGELHEDYHENLGGVKAADGVCCNFLRVHYRDLRDRVLQGGTDEEILDPDENDGSSDQRLHNSTWNLHNV